MSGLSKSDYRYFDMARRVAQHSEFNTFHLGCVMVYKGSVITTGANSHKTHPKQHKYNKYRKFRPGSKPIKDSLHAEIAALTQIPYVIDQTIDYSKVKVYIYRICPGKKLGFGNSRSCPACMAALRAKGIQHLYYTTDSGYAYERILL